MRIFVTGGTGFFGKSVLERRVAVPGSSADRYTILSRDPEAFRRANPRFAGLPGVDWVKGDVRDFAFPDGPFDAIVHAATSAVTTLSDAEQTSVILDGARHVAAFAKACGCHTVLFTSSGAVYGPQTAPVSEDAPCRPATAYGKGKLAAERLLLDAGLDVKIARCFAFTGPFLNRDIHYAVGNFVRDALAGRPIVIQGDGTPRRSYLFADDLVDWLFAILERGETGRPYNVGSDRAVSIQELAETVARVLGPGTSPVPHLRMPRSLVKVMGRPTGAPPSVYVPVVERAKRELGLSVTVPLDAAIRKSV